MNRITFPLNRETPPGQSLADLQEGLLLLVEKDSLRLPEDEGPAFVRELRRERARGAYGDATDMLVRLFQAQHLSEPRRLGPVNKRTATALNKVLEELGAFPRPEPGQRRVVAGRVSRDDGRPFPDAVVRAFHAAGTSMVRLGEDTTDAEGQFTIPYAMLPDVDAIHLRVIVFDGNGEPLQVSEIREAKPLEIVDLVVPSVDRATFEIEGKVASRSSAAVSGLQVRIVDRAVGGDVHLADTETDEEGEYRTSIDSAGLRQRGKELPDLQAHVFADGEFLAASEVRYNATTRETLNVLLEEKAGPALRSEHEELTKSLRRHFRGKLGDLKETDDRQDVTYLANKTGWDARAVALAALADQFSARARDGNGNDVLKQPHFYALFRAGISANDSALYQTDGRTVKAIWERAITQGVIPAELERNLPEAVEQFQKLVARRLLDGPALVGASSLKELLSVSIGDDSEQQQQFANLYTRHRDDLPEFWEAVRGAFGEEMETRLKLDGQLAYLTLNNAPMIRKLHTEGGNDRLTSAMNLVEGGYHRAAKWRETIGDDPVPPGIPGQNEAEKRARYAEFLSAQVRLSFPTGVVAQMVKGGETVLADGALRNQVHAFLTQHQENFEIGMQPVEQYVAQNNLDVPAVVTREVTRIQRVNQITQSDDAMNALLSEGIDSAYNVVRYGRDEFVQSFKDRVGGEANAQLIHARSQQVHNAVLNIAVSYVTASIAPGIGVHSPAQILNPAPNPHASDVIAYSTLENLFGEMDYCACEHCRSILSPAAYLVDLLYFLDHEPAGAEITPLQVLLSRRPDIQHLPLTCENTIRPLPYIDLVNETLEYYIVSDPTSDPPKPPLTLGKYEGHTTDDSATPEELLASPMFVRPEAYTTLAEARFPPPLPFHQPLENLRRYFDKFEAPLPEVMEALRKNDDLERPGPADPAHSAEYGWRDVLMEELHISRAEYALLTNRTITMQQLYGFTAATSDADVLAELSKAKAFTRRVRISYEDIIDILKTRFVNPNATLIPKLERLGVAFATLKEFKDGAIADEAFDDALATHIDPAQFGGDIKAWVRNEANYAKIMSLITLTTPAVPWAPSVPYGPGDRVIPTSAPTGTSTHYECTTPGISARVEPRAWPPASGETVTDGTVVWTCRVGSNDCDFDTLRFRYADPDRLGQSLRAFEFVRLSRFIRLWKKLGWTIEQTDKAITALYPTNHALDDDDDAVNLQRLDDGFLTMLPRLGAVKRVMDALRLKPEKDLLPLLACFAPIDTHGSDSLYRQMFLGPASLEDDGPFADDGYGNFLTDNTQKLSQHAEALRAAFLLTDDEFSLITSALGFDDNTPLGHEASAAEETSPADYHVKNVSAVFRRGWLARKLRLSVRELLLLTKFSGFDPFAAPDPPSPGILDLIELVSRFRTTSLKPVEALYLIWNQDISGKSAPDDDDVAGFARSLRSDLAAIESEFVLGPDPDGQVARDRMAQVYGTDATDHFFGLLEDTVVTDIEYTHGQETLEQPILDAGMGDIGYDNLRKRLSYSAGVMPDVVRNALTGVAGVTQAFIDAVDDLHKKTRQFFDRYPELLAHYNTYVASGDPKGKKRSDLLANLLPQLKRERKSQQALQAITGATKTVAALGSALLDNSTDDKYVLHAAGDTDLHAAGHTDRPALDDLTDVETPGLSAQFFFRDTASGVVDDERDAEANLAYSGTNSNELPDSGVSPLSGVWRGYLEAPENGFYNLRIEADSGSSVTLDLGGESVTLDQSDNLWSSHDAIELRAGTLYAMSLSVEKVKDELNVRWETAGRGWETIPGRYLYSATLSDHLGQVYVRFLKAASLGKALDLTATEMAYLVSRADYQIGAQGWLNSLSGTESPDNVTSTALLKALNALLDFAHVKADLSADDERLLDVLKDPAEASENSDSPLFTLTRWEAESLDSLLIRFGKVDGGNANRDALKDLSTFRRVYDAYASVRKLGVSASALIRATTNEPVDATVRDLQAALRARYDESDWLNVLQPINDEMRALQRDALVAYILHQMRLDPDAKHIDTPEKLFEYFLMDVEMDPCMQTSRIRHALSSVQLFIERGLMNLEPRVQPSLINARHWEWMSRYRVWEANRKVFLYPENWLEPELRDDQSPFFRETMSELLQSDITEDRAATALLNYLSKLEEVAKLEACGIHYVEGDSEDKNDIAHVVARTAGGNRKYYYRRRQGISWTPWEQIKLDIEDNPVIPVVWKNRLFLFWLRILKEAPLDPDKLPTSSGPRNENFEELPIKDVKPSQIKKNAKKDAKNSIKVIVKAVLCWSEYFNGKWQPTRTSDIDRPLLVDQVNPAGTNIFYRSELKLSVMSWTKGAIRVIVSNQVGYGASFLLHNVYSSPEPRTPKKQRHFAAKRILDTNTKSFKVDYPDSDVAHPILTNGISHGTVEPHHSIGANPWDAPFFYEDDRHVFYVTTDGHVARVPVWNDFAVLPKLRKPEFDIPPLILEPVPIIADPVGPIIRQPGFGVVDPSPIERYVTEDAYITRGIGSSGTVRFGDKEIGPAGSQPTSIRVR